MISAEWIWRNGSLVPWEDAKVHVLTHGLLYGTSVFEGIKCYETAFGPRVFRLRDHMDRLMRSARIYLMRPTYTAEDLCLATLATINANGLGGCYIRPAIFAGAGDIGVLPADAPIETVISAFSWHPYLHDSGSGIRVLLSSVRRIHIASTPPEAKASGHYLNSLLAKHEAVSAGYDEAVMANDLGHFVEGSAQNLFVVRDGVLITPPISDGALAGLTRDSVLALARILAQPVEFRPILRSDLILADEVFLTGTATEIAAVGEVSGRRLDAPGPITTSIRTAFQDMLDGKVPDLSAWLTEL